MSISCIEITDIIDKLTGLETNKIQQAGPLPLSRTADVYDNLASLDTQIIQNRLSKTSRERYTRLKGIGDDWREMANIVSQKGRVISPRALAVILGACGRVEGDKRLYSSAKSCRYVVAYCLAEDPEAAAMRSLGHILSRRADDFKIPINLKALYDAINESMGRFMLQWIQPDSQLSYGDLSVCLGLLNLEPKQQSGPFDSARFAETLGQVDFMGSLTGTPSYPMVHALIREMKAEYFHQDIHVTQLWPLPSSTDDLGSMHVDEIGTTSNASLSSYPSQQCRFPGFNGVDGSVSCNLRPYTAQMRTVDFDTSSCIAHTVTNPL